MNKNSDKVKRWRAKYPERAKNRNLLDSHGMTLIEYNQLITKQNSQCAICKKLYHKLRVDHDHTTGKIRELLCVSCNTGLGLFLDNFDLLLDAAKYLQKHNNIT